MSQTKQEKAAAEAKAKATAAAAAAKEQSAAANAAAINAKIQAQQMLLDRVNFKKGLTEERPVSYEALNQQLELSQGLMQTAIGATQAATDAQTALTNFQYIPPQEEEITKDIRDAYALLKETFRSYGLESLVPAIEGFMKRNLGPNEALIELRATPEYVARFKGNELRRDSGKNALSEAEYLAVEDAYDQTLRAYGQQDYFGIDRKAKQAKAAELIGSDISAVEFKDRIQLAVDRVQNADPMTKKVLKDFYPTLNEADLIGYFLNPKDNLPKLQEKVTASEIGAAARNLNLATDVAAATDLAKYGVTQAQAREGYSTISGILPTASKLSNIYGETGVKYAQAEGEAEVFKGNQDAATKRKRLASMERAAFSGSAGTNQGSLTRSTQGRI
jgi:hypothetical protein